jgi:hypothetical protein
MPKRTFYGNLAKKKMIKDNLCPICMQEEETPYHVLWSCPAARDTWGVGNRIFQKTVVEGTYFVQVAETFLTKGTKEEAVLFVRIARRLWFRRNDLVFNGKFTHPTEKSCSTSS